jgi:amino-acid N-acetyltransferase
VIVPGARERIEEVLDLYGVRTELSGRMRISSPESLPFIKMAAFDVVNRFMDRVQRSQCHVRYGQLG